MRVGDKVTVQRGGFGGLSGAVTRIDGDQVSLLGDINGELSGFDVDVTELAPELPSAEIIRAARARNAIAHRLQSYWAREAQRRPTRAPDRLLAEYALHAASLEAPCQAEADRELARWQAACAGLDDDTRAEKWQAERAAWLADHEGDALRDQIVAELLPDLPERERLEAYEKLVDAGTQLHERARLEVMRSTLATPLPVELRNEALERQIEADIDRDDAFLVYADWLQSQGDARGEFMALEAAGSQEANRLRATLVPRALGPLVAVEDRLRPTWRLGFLDSIVVHTPRDDEHLGLQVDEVLRVALALPAARFLRELEIGLPSAYENCSVGATLAAAGPRPTLRSLVLTTDTEEEMLSWTSAGDLAALPDLYPNLEWLEILAGSFQLPSARFPKLRTLMLQTCRGSAALVRTILAEGWPVLETLELWFGSRMYGVTVTLDDITPILRAPWPSLRALGLCNCEVTDELCEMVLASPLLPQLKRLSLAKGTMTDAGADALVRDVDRLRHLEWIEVDDNYLGNGALNRLRDAGLPIETTWQREEDEGERYASVGE